MTEILKSTRTHFTPLLIGLLSCGICAAKPTEPPVGFVRIPAGEFTMGSIKDDSNHNAPLVKVHVSGFYLAKHEAARGGVSGQRFPWGDTISHSQANFHVKSADDGKMNHYSYDVTPRPPATGTEYFHPTYNDGTTPYTAPFGSFAPNGYGLFDMAGNVREWNWDLFSVSTAPAYAPDASDPKGASSGSVRVLRGGGWYSSAFDCRSSYRLFWDPGYLTNTLGFRPARSSVP